MCGVLGNNPLSRKIPQKVLPNGHSVALKRVSPRSNGGAPIKCVTSFQLWKMVYGTIRVLNRTQPVYSGVFTSSNSHLGPTKNRRDVIYDAKNCARQSSSTSISKFELWKRKCGLELAGYKFRCLAHFHAILQCIKSFSKFEIVRRFELNFLE